MNALLRKTWLKVKRGFGFYDWFFALAFDGYDAIRQQGRSLAEVYFPKRSSGKSAARQSVQLAVEQLEIREVPTAGINEYTIPTGSSAPRGIAAQTSDSSTFWFAETGTNKIAKIDSSNNFTEYTVPTSSSNPWDIAAAPADDAMWFTEAGTDKIGRVDYSGNFTEYNLTAASMPHGITLGPDGNLWFTMPGRGYVGYITTGGSITEYNVGGQPENIVAGPDGNLWFTDYSGNKIVKITTGGSATSYTVPTGSSNPYGITSDGTYLWFTEYGTDKIGKVTTSGTFTEYSLTASSQPRDIIYSARDGGYLLFTEAGTNKIGRSTTGGTITEWSGLTSSSVPFGIAERSDGAFLFTENSGNKIGKAVWSAAGAKLESDPQQGAYMSYGQSYAVSPQTGDLWIQVPLDVQGRATPDVFGASPSLTYTLSTVNVKPIVQTTFTTADGSAAPSQLDLQLTWNGGSPQSWVTFTTTGHSANDTYVLADQVSSAVTTSGLYTWQLEVKATYSGGNVFSRIVTGSSYITVNGSGSPYGQGWSLAGVDRVTSVTGGMVWESATGGYRFFSGSGGTYTSPANDFGTLVKNGDNTYTYTDKFQYKWDFDTSGILQKQTDPHGLLRTFSYNAGKVETIIEPDASRATFAYSSGKLQTITAPGNRVYTFTVDGSGNLTVVQSPDGVLRTFTYDGSSRPTNEKVGLVNTTFAYDTYGNIGTITLDAGQSAFLKNSAANTVALATTPAKNQSDGVGVLTDALSRRTTFLMDSLGRVTQLKTADGATQSLQLNSAGLATVVIDGLSNRTTTTYNAAGDATQIDYADGSADKYTYHATYHKVASYEDRRSVPGTEILTTYTYNGANGDLTSIEDANNKLVTYTYASGLVESTKDQLGNVTTYQYSGRKLEATIAPDLTRSTFLYDSAGNQTVTIDALLRRTTTAFDAMRRATTITYANGTVVTYLYNANGLVTDQTDDGGFRSTFAYDQRLQLTASTFEAGQVDAKTSYNYYDVVGNLTGVKDPNNFVTTFLYDSLDRHTGTLDPTAAGPSTYFDLAGNVTGTRDSAGRLTQYLFDSMNRHYATVDGFGGRVTHLFDIASNVTGTLDGNNELTQFLLNKLGQVTGTSDPLSNDTSSLYDAAGRLTVSIDPLGNRTTYLFDSKGRQTGTLDALNFVWTSVYDDYDNLIATVDPRGSRTTFLYDNLNRQTVTIDPLGNRVTTLYDSKNRVTGTQDARGNLTQFLYDTLNRQTVTIDAASNRVTSLLDAGGRVTGMLDARNKLTTFLLDSAGRTTVVIDPLGNRVTTTYNGAGQATARTDANGNTTSYLFDGNGRATVTIDALSNRTTSFYDAAGYLTGVQDARAGWTTFMYDDAGRQTRTYDQLGNYTETHYDDAGNVEWVHDANANYTYFTYDALNRATVTLDPANYTTTLVYGPSGLVSMSYDKRGGITTFLYDAAGRQTVVINPLTFRTTSLLDAAGNTTVVIDANTNRVTTLFDALNRATQVTDGRANSRYTYFDAAGNVTGVKDARDNWTTFSYDDAGRQVNVFDANGNRTTTIYDKAGNATVTIDVLENRTTFLVDALNRSTVTIDSLSNRTTKMYDAVGNLTALKDASNNLTTFGYDAANRKIRETDPLGEFATFAYDAGGRMTATTDRLGRRRDFYYTGRNELNAELWYDSGGSLVETRLFFYDAQSNLATYTYSTPNVNYTFLYDALDRVTGVTEFGKLLTMTYDNVGNRKTFTTEIGTTTYTYDAANNMTRTEFAASGLPTMVADFSYNAVNMLESVTRYSDMARTVTVAYSTYLYDALNRITSQNDRKGSDNSSLASYAYLYDTASRITSQTINTATNTFAFDATNQMTGDGTTNVTYDATGNRNNGSYTVGSGNRLTNDGTWTYTYDDEGNLKTKANSGAGAVTWTYDYDNKNQLLAATKRLASDDSLQLRVSFTYDVFGNRIKKEVDSDGDSVVDTTERYWYDAWKTDHGRSGPFVGNENWDIWADSDGDGVIQTNYLRAEKIDSLSARFGTGASNVRWILSDYQGSVRNVLDSGGANKDVIAYDGYGKIASETDANERGRYTWTGREIDVETGLRYNRARYYDPDTARWISQDPLGFDAGDSNLYRYVHNESTRNVDPSGAQAVEIRYEFKEPSQKIKAKTVDEFTWKEVEGSRDWDKDEKGFRVKAFFVKTKTSTVLWQEEQVTRTLNRDTYRIADGKEERIAKHRKEAARLTVFFEKDMALAQGFGSAFDALAISTTFFGVIPGVPAVAAYGARMAAQDRAASTKVAIDAHLRVVRETEAELKDLAAQLAANPDKFYVSTRKVLKTVPENIGTFIVDFKFVYSKETFNDNKGDKNAVKLVPN